VSPPFIARRTGGPLGRERSLTIWFDCKSGI
jgi:hypothetical protein